MSTDVVGLISHTRWDIRICAHADEEDSEVADADGIDPADEWETGDGDNGVDDDDWASSVVLIAEVASEVPDIVSTHFITVGQNL